MQAATPTNPLAEARQRGSIGSPMEQYSPPKTPPQWTVGFDRKKIMWIAEFAFFNMLRP